MVYIRRLTGLVGCLIGSIIELQLTGPIFSGRSLCMVTDLCLYNPLNIIFLTHDGSINTF